MNSCDFYFAIAKFQMYYYVLPLIAYWFTRKKTKKSDKYFAAYLLIQLALGLWSYWYMYQGHTNLFISNYVTLIEIILGIVWFPLILSNIECQKWSRYIGFAMVLGWLMYPLIFHEYINIYDEINTLHCIYLCLFAGLGIFDFLTKDNRSENISTSDYYFLIGLFVTNSIAGFYKFFETEIISQDQFLACTTEAIDCLLIMAGITIYAWAFYKKMDTRFDTSEQKQ
jgi:hypothetical protein